ncbi:DUF6526 family protein [Ferruginibacter sp.]
MAAQNFKNHSRYVPLFHFIAFPAAGFPLVSSILYFIKCLRNESGRVHAAAMVSLTVAVVLALWFARAFALRAQDRAIRAEENLRYFAMTGNLLDNKLRMSQIIALRFAPNNEFVELAHRAVAENLSSKQIKQAIQHWKTDNNRV